MLDSSKVARPLGGPGLGYTYLGSIPTRSSRAIRRIRSSQRCSSASRALDGSRSRRHAANVFGRRAGGHGPLPLLLPRPTAPSNHPLRHHRRVGVLIRPAGVLGPPTACGPRRKPPLKFSLLIPSTTALRVSSTQLLQEQFRRVGVTLGIESVWTSETYTDHVQTGLRAGDSTRPSSFSTDPRSAAFAELGHGRDRARGQSYQSLLEPEGRTPFSTPSRRRSI